jgi:CheY-like chemotaxis protein
LLQHRETTCETTIILPHSLTVFTAVQHEPLPHIPLRVLLVEDSALDADVLVRFLKYHDIVIDYDRVDTMAQLQNALAQDWDFIFCDYNIHTGFTGMDALGAIRRYEALQAPPTDDLPKLPVPVIMISSILNEPSVVAAMNAGATDFIIKGYLERLVPLLHREMRYINRIRYYFTKWQHAEERLRG